MILTCRGKNSWYLNLSISFALAIGFFSLRKSKLLSWKKNWLRIEVLHPCRVYLWSFMFSPVFFFSSLKARFKTEYSRGEKNKIKWTVFNELDYWTCLKKHFISNWDPFFFKILCSAFRDFLTVLKANLLCRSVNFLDPSELQKLFVGSKLDETWETSWQNRSCQQWLDFEE